MKTYICYKLTDCFQMIIKSEAALSTSSDPIFHKSENKSYSSENQPDKKCNIKYFLTPKNNFHVKRGKVS